MGEIAEDMIDGVCCSGCSVYFDEEYGYPVICEDCGKDYTDRQLESMGVQRA